jgi:hypothetical protein
MNIPVYTWLGFLGFLLLIAGVFLILAGFDFLKINAVTVKPGRSTWIIGIVTAILGLVLLAYSEPIKTRVVATTNTPTELSSTIETTVTPTTNISPVSGLIPCRDTGDLAGTEVTCKMSRAYCSYQSSTTGSPTFCNDAPYPNQRFSFVVWGEDWSDYDGKCIVINGLVTIYQGKPQVVGTSRSQVSLCP